MNEHAKTVYILLGLSLIGYLSVWFIPADLYQEIKSKASSLLTTKAGRTKLQTDLDKINTLVFSIVGFISALILYFSKTLLLQFGPQYVSAHVPLITLTLAVCIASSCHIAAALMIYAGKVAFSYISLNANIYCNYIVQIDYLFTLVFKYPTIKVRVYH